MRTVIELEKHAGLDLKAPSLAAQLRWSLWNAEAEGAYKDALIHLKDMNLWDRSVRAMQMTTMLTSLKEAWDKDKPPPDILMKAREELIHTRSCVKFTQHVLGILSKALDRMQQKPGQMSQVGKNTMTQPADLDVSLPRVVSDRSGNREARTAVGQPRRDVAPRSSYLPTPLGNPSSASPSPAGPTGSVALK